MLRILPGRPWPLYDVAASRAIEAQAIAALAPTTLMQRAGDAVARLALAVAPHARHVWLACGPGNNGGDGLEAALRLHQRGVRVSVTWLGDEVGAPADARAALVRARAGGVRFTPEPPQSFDLVVDALLGLGTARPLEAQAAAWVRRMHGTGAPVVAVDLPSGLSGDTGTGAAVVATHTLALLTLKPGLFTAGGRDATGVLWFDDLGVQSACPPTAWLNAAPPHPNRPHDSHKGTWGDVAVVGGAPGLGGAAALAAQAALHAGAGRVFVALLQDEPALWDSAAPELMFRTVDALKVAELHVACGCGGGERIHAVLPKLLSSARSLVLDADALNAVAADASLQRLLQARGGRAKHRTVLTPHPLEAARLLGCSTAAVQADRVAAARALTLRFGCVVVLKGSGSVIAAPGEPPRINPTGNARLATAGTGDVLAGCIAARLAAGQSALHAAASAVYVHGLAADDWPDGQALSAGALARRMRY